MLVLSRNVGESVQIRVTGLDQPITVSIVRVSRNRVRVGFVHPDRHAVTVVRTEKTVTESTNAAQQRGPIATPLRLIGATAFVPIPH
jgi:carbon storage regulator CsrA